LDLRQLECFLAVADELHFGRAAKRIHLAQPTVSEAIRRLERSLGAPLFNRTTRQVVLTEFGEAFLVEACAAYQRVEEAFETGRRLAQRTPEQFLVGYATDLSQALLQMIPALRSRLSNVTMTLLAMTTRQQIEALRRRRLHVGICWLPELDDELQSVVLGVAHFAALVPHGHPLADLPAVTMRRLAGEPLIGWPRSLHPALYDLFATSMDATLRPWTLVGTAVGIDNVASRVIAEHGIGVMPMPFTTERTFDSIACIPVSDGPDLERRIVWRRDERSQAVTVFLELLRALDLAGAGADPVRPLTIDVRQESTARVVPWPHDPAAAAAAQPRRARVR
jgi:DNA-binding transcriptional LysR family regulator